MSDPIKPKTVREYTKQDSAFLIDMLGPFLDIDRETLGDLFSEYVAEIPVHSKPGMYDSEGLVGAYSRLPGGKDRKIFIDTDYESSLTEAGTYRTQQNSVIHEAFGHALLEALTGYQKKPHWSRREEFPYYVQGYSNMNPSKKGEMTAEQFINNLQATMEFHALSKKHLQLK